MQRRSFTPQQQSSSVIVRTPPDACRMGESFGIMFRWRNSIYKMVWRHSLVFLTLYFALSALYNYGLEKKFREHFEAITEYCARYTRSFNWMIMLGFFTNTALHRMFTMQMTMPGTSRSITAFIMSLKPDLPEGPDIVDQFARWVTLVWILTFRSVCKPLRDQYPDLNSIQSEGILLEQEKRILDRQGYETPRPLIVFEWLLLLLKESLLNDRYINKSSHNKNVENLMTFRKSCSNIVKFSTQNIPYAVIQAAILVVYCFGMIIAMARNLPKFEDKVVRQIIAYFPLIPYIQYFVFIAWLSCGRAAVNPFGDDDTDIDIRKLSQRHIVDSLRLRKIYTKTLDDVFKNLPQKKFKVINNGTACGLPNQVLQPKVEETRQSALLETKAHLMTRIITDV